MFSTTWRPKLAYLVYPQYYTWLTACSASILVDRMCFQMSRSDVKASPHLNEGAQGFLVQSKEAILDLHHVHFTTCHHHTNKGAVICTKTLCVCVFSVCIYSLSSLCTCLYVCLYGGTNVQMCVFLIACVCVCVCVCVYVCVSLCMWH